MARGRRRDQLPGGEVEQQHRGRVGPQRLQGPVKQLRQQLTIIEPGQRRVTLRQISRVDPGTEVRLVPAAHAQRPREVNPEHFSIKGRLPSGFHVLLVDDTWAGGGHAQSAAIALSQAGARRVSLLVAARWVKVDYGSNASFLNKLSGRDYDPAICPWTGGNCP